MPGSFGQALPAWASRESSGMVLERPLMTAPSPSPRKLAGIAVILLLILIWAVMVAALSTWVGRWPVLVQALFYLVVGIVWIGPLKPLIRWMETGAFRPAEPPDN